MNLEAKKYCNDFASETTNSRHDFLEVCRGFDAGYDYCQKEYEEKLRWISIHEKDAPNEIVQMKLENGEIRFGYFTDKFKSSSDYNQFVKVTHYRTLSFYSAT
jgi:hypothetical protein